MASAAVGGVVTGSLRPLADKATSLLSEELELLMGVKNEIEALKHTVVEIEAVLEDAEEKQSKDRVVAGWLEVLRDVAYEADDVLDEFLTEVSAVRSRRAAGTAGVCRFLCSPVVDCSCDVLFRRRIAKRIVDVKKRLAERAEAQKSLGLNVSSGVAPSETEILLWKRRETSSVVDSGFVVVGREKEKEEIVLKLLNFDDSAGTSSGQEGFVGSGGGERVSLIPIVGMGGIGKTTLAQAVFDDPRVKEKFPKIRKWLFVGKNFDARGLIMKIIVDSPTDDGKSFTDLSLEKLHTMLVDKVKHDKFLIVLDDAWSENHDEWKQLWTPLTHGGKGSKVLVTARTGQVVNAIASVNVKALDFLSDGDCWSIFEKHAFECGDSSGKPELIDYGHQIVEKLKGIPLAAKIAGGFLRNASEDIWRSTSQQSEMWPMIHDENDILPVLKLSYQYLATHLKHCFVLFSAFPKNYRFEKSSLVQIWMAHDFIKPQRGKRSEDIGSIYFDDLIDRCFLQYMKGKYEMHDLMHDLAQSISREECLIIRGTSYNDHGLKVRHMSFHDGISKNNDLQYLCGYKKLRTLVHIYEHPVVPFEILPRGLFKRLSCIRVLDLSTSNIQKLPKSIGSLKHLRYLNLLATPILKLPKSLCSLYNLQTLLLAEDHCKLPMGMNKLINLRHLEADPRETAKITGVGKLTSLQELKAFSVSRRNGHGIKELASMKRLRQLCVWNLENVGSGEEARQAEMNDKVYLHDLELVWSENLTNLIDLKIKEEVLQCLQPPPSLRSLKITNYCGIHKPSWMGSLSGLVSIRLCQCEKWKLLPTLGQLIHLKNLEIVGFNEVEKVGQEFYGDENGNAFLLLENLLFEDMGKWKEWTGVEKGLLFPSLRILHVKKCPLLMKLPQLPFLLSKLNLINVGVHTFPGFWIRSNSVMQSKFSTLLSVIVISCNNLTDLSSLLQHQLNHLQCMIVKDCKELISLWEDGKIGTLESLELLTIQDCPKLMHLPEKGFANLSSLSSFDIVGCPIIDSLPEKLMRHLNKLEKLEIRSCGELKSVDLQCLSSLRSLRIIDCLQLSSFGAAKPVAFKSLTSLEISQCPSISGFPREILHHMRNLEKLDIKNCKELSSLDLQGLVSLKWLCVEDCPNLEISGTFSSHVEDHSFSSLEFLCSNNRSVIEWLLHKNLASLEILLIDRCSQLTSISEHGWQNLTSLRELCIYNCEELKSLPESLQGLSKLEELTIFNCPGIEKLPDEGLPLYLNQLWIAKCPKLRKSCQQKGHADYRKIAHIRKRYIE